MNKKTKTQLICGSGCLAAFILWTILVCIIDVQPIGPQGSCVGFATLNRFVHTLTGEHRIFYLFTDWLGLIPILFMIGFAVLGCVQWGKRKSLRRVDRSILVLGCFYIVVFAVYLLFEELKVNYRPILIDGQMEVSYPSSTTMLALCVMTTAIMQLHRRLKESVIRRYVRAILTVFTVFMVIGRIVSGVHWITDIIGGVLISGGLVLLYSAVVGQQETSADEEK